MLVTKFPFGMEQRRVLRQVLAIHDEVLPVHVDQEARSVDSQTANTVNGVEGGGNIAHENVHSRFAVFVFQEDRHSLRRSVCHHFAHAIDKLVPGVGVFALEIVVVAFSAGPDDKVCSQRGGEINAPLECVDTSAP